jgi:pimeloyl-ACP methyl ester carboxylesterase
LAIPAVFSLRHRYHELLMPLVILAGDADRHVDTAAQSERLHRELPHSALRVTAGAGHMLHHVAQREVMEAIEQAEHGMGAVELAQMKGAFPAPAQIN